MAIFVSDTEPSPTTNNDRLSRTPDDPAGLAAHAVNLGGSSGQLQDTAVEPTVGGGYAVDGNSPRPVITGAQIAIPITNQCLIDWAAFTFKPDNPYEVLEILKLDAALFTEMERGHYGYSRTLRSGSIAIFYEGRENMGCHVTMTGQGCRQYEAQFTESPWLDLFTNALAHKATFTRLDLAHDNVDSTLDLEKLKSAVLNQEIRTRFKSASQIQGYGLSRGAYQAETGDNTIYFGKRSSRVFLRFYDKSAQLGLPFVWRRAEFELKDKRAQEAVKLLASGIPAGQLFVGILNQYLAVINSDNLNTSRCTVQDWWAAWLQSTEKIKLTTTPQIKTVEEAMAYLQKQYAPLLAVIREYLGRNGFEGYVSHLLNDGSKRLSMRHEQMLFVSTQGRADNYDDDRITREERIAMMIDGGLTREEAERMLSEQGASHE